MAVYTSWEELGFTALQLFTSQQVEGRGSMDELSTCPGPRNYELSPPLALKLLTAEGDRAHHHLPGELGAPALVSSGRHHRYVVAKP